jgi:hypothetical protein
MVCCCGSSAEPYIVPAMDPWFTCKGRNEQAVTCERVWEDICSGPNTNYPIREEHPFANVTLFVTGIFTSDIC